MLKLDSSAFTSPQFVEWLESKLDQIGVRKLVPDQGTLEKVYRAHVAAVYFREHTKDVMKSAQAYAKTQTLPNDLVGKVQAQLESTPEIPWDEAAAQLVMPIDPLSS